MLVSLDPSTGWLHETKQDLLFVRHKMQKKRVGEGIKGMLRLKIAYHHNDPIMQHQLSFEHALYEDAKTPKITT